MTMVNSSVRISSQYFVVVKTVISVLAIMNKGIGFTIKYICLIDGNGFSSLKDNI